MSVPTIPNSISFRNISDVFGGTDPISLSEYFANANPSYTSGVTGIPNSTINPTTSISLSQFSGKSKPVTAVNYMLAGNVGGNMNTAGGTQISYGNLDDGSSSIGTVGFSFFFFGADYNNNIFWSTNQVLQFGTNTNTINWAPGTGNGILLGNTDRIVNSVFQFPSTTINNHSIKKIIIDHNSWWSRPQDGKIKMEIRLIRGPQFQYVEVRMAEWTGVQGGTWAIAISGTNWINVFNATTGPPVGTGGSFVLRSDLNGNNWEFFNNYYVNL